MFRTALTICYVLTAVLGPRACCRLLCTANGPMASPHAVASAASVPVAPANAHACPHCCPGVAEPIKGVAANQPANVPTEKPNCPCKDGIAPDPTAVVAAPHAVAADLLDDPSAAPAPWGESLVVTRTLDRPAGPTGGPPAPFLTADRLVRVFHLMRC